MDNPKNTIITNASNEKERKSTISRATKEEIQDRLEKVEEILATYKDMDKPDFFDAEWSKIIKEGFSINEFYRLMCGSPTNSDDIGLFEKKISLENFKKMLKDNGYSWEEYVRLDISEEDAKKIDLARALYICLENESNIDFHLESFQNTITTHYSKIKDTRYQHNLFHLNIYFTDIKDTSIIAEYIYQLFNDSLLGIIPAIGMIQVHASNTTRAKRIMIRLSKIYERGIFLGTDIKE